MRVRGIITARSPHPKEDQLSNNTYSIPHSYSYHTSDFLQSVQCLLNNTSVSTTVSSRDLSVLSSTLRSIVPAPEEFEKNFRNPCWYMHLNLPQKVNKVLLGTRGNISDGEASSLMNLIFSSSPTTNRKSPQGLSTSADRSLFCWPSIYFIGFPRSGSTQLYKMLVSHPDLAGGMNKEPHWWTRHMFSSNFPHSTLSVLRYLAHFQEASREMVNHTQRLLIDGSQSTAWDVRMSGNLCAVPRLIKSVVPNAKFLVLMRNPIDRLFSDFKYLCEEALRVKLLKNKGGNKTASEKDQFISDSLHSFNVSADIFHEVVKEEMDSFERCLTSGNALEFCTHLSTVTVPTGRKIQSTVVSAECSRVRLGISLYHVHLTRWLNVIEREQMMFVRTEDMARDPYALLERIWRFLGVKNQAREDLNEILHKHLHQSSVGHGNSTAAGSADIAMHQKTRHLLEKFFQPHNSILSNLLGEAEFNWSDDG